MSNLSKISYAAIFISFWVFFASCNKPEKPIEKFVSPPFETVNVDYNNFEVEADKEKVITMSHGTKIIIPSGAFVDKDNQPLVGTVKLKYREFHDAADIIAAGVSMEYDSGGVTNHFQTAGMFEITGTQNGTPVFIKNGKSIEVKLASKVEGNSYNFYSQDTASKKWVYKGKSIPEPIEENLKAVEAKIGSPVVQPVLPQSYDPDKFVFDVKINTKNYPELTDFHDIIWQYAGNNDSIDPEKNDWVFTEKWTDMTLQINDVEKSVFWLKLSNKNKNFKTLVQAVFSDKKIGEAKKNFEKRNKDYQAYLEKKRVEYKILNNEYNFVRSFPIYQLGYHNWDQIIEPFTEFVTADFEFDQKEDNDFVKIILVMDNNRVAIQLSKEMWTKLPYSSSEHSFLVAILPGNKIAINTDLRNDPFGLGDSAPEKFTFKFKTINKSITKTEDLREVISKI